MSRSHNRVACSRSGTSQRRWRRHASHAERGQVKAAVRAGAEVLPERREATNNYESPKDDYSLSFPGDEFWAEDHVHARK